MNSKECLENIAIEFDNMGMICSNIGYKEFWEKDLHFKEIFKYEYKVISQSLDKLKQLEKENQELKETINDLQKDYDALDFEQVELYAENTKLKKALDILTNNKFYIYGIKTFSSVKQYNNIIIGTEFDKLTQEEFELLKEVLQDDR